MKILTQLNKQAQEQLNKKVKLISIISLITGVIGFIVYIVLATILEPVPEILQYLLYLFSFMFGFGLIFILALKNNLKNVESLKVVNEYEFFENHLMINSIKNEEIMGTEKLYYKDILKIKETEQYLFLYKTKTAIFPILKTNKEEIENIKELILKNK